MSTPVKMLEEVKVSRLLFLSGEVYKVVDSTADKWIAEGKAVLAPGLCDLIGAAKPARVDFITPEPPLPDTDQEILSDRQFHETLIRKDVE